MSVAYLPLYEIQLSLSCCFYYFTKQKMGSKVLSKLTNMHNCNSHNLHSTSYVGQFSQSF